jgi:hypothetical protein
MASGVLEDVVCPGLIYQHEFHARRIVLSRILGGQERHVVSPGLPGHHEQASGTSHLDGCRPGEFRMGLLWREGRCLIGRRISSWYACRVFP